MAFPFTALRYSFMRRVGVRCPSSGIDTPERVGARRCRVPPVDRPPTFVAPSHQLSPQTQPEESPDARCSLALSPTPSPRSYPSSPSSRQYGAHELAGRICCAHIVSAPPTNTSPDCSDESFQLDGETYKNYSLITSPITSYGDQVCDSGGPTTSGGG